MSRSLLKKGVGIGGVTPPPSPHPISQLIRGCSFKDDRTVILLLGVSFMVKSHSKIPE
jgi:hypothetical protein